ncbi:hypothetical protein MAPG_04512 [Magnaporthiopsis poae ATCC 64411]|uniref:Heterokaryon incompatibility domain-containing protein n=1 Tax=Magnaporthiopsis poae (strain ATCC 64411 / 73-15) TaxID=644358 RepID=A0A0C4DWX8_MAGP6|nr:hypothetical protein MAPG_04512 [Magnaporthiopsis poae ATCC 64411]
MDILPSPSGESLLGQTPYVGGDTRWDCGPFLHYACRRGCLEIVPLHLRKCDCPIPHHDGENSKPLGQDERDSLLQTWLFFGLLAELYGLNDEPTSGGSAHPEAIPSHPDKDAGIRSLYARCIRPTAEVEGDGQKAYKYYISGAILNEPAGGEEVQRHFTEKLDGLGRARFTKYLDYLEECLQFVNCFVSHFDTNKTGFPPPISVSISALGEAFVSELKVLTRLHKLPRIMTGTWGASYLQMGGKVEREMLERGWCKSDIERIRQSVDGLATRNFLSNIEKPEGCHHDSCSVRICNAAQIDDSNYALAHDESCSGCDVIGIDQEEVKAILNVEESEAFPLLRLELGGVGDGRVAKIHVERYDENKPYVALSHVWADGLGNPRENALQSCQMDRLARLIKEMPYQAVPREAGGQAEPEERPRYWFWIDTLCCPISLKEKRIALERIAAVYRRAAHVLVLDKSVFPFTSDGEGPAKAAENCLRMVGSSTWMRRLWTLQEGALARSLYFQFKDRPIQLDQESERLFEFGLSHHRYEPIAIDVAIMIHKLTIFCSPSPGPSLSEDEDSIQRDRKRYLQQVANAQSLLYFRNVSKMSDEPLCITTLLSLNPNAMTMAGSCRQQRMAKVWKLLAERCGNYFTPRVIFYNDQPLGLASLSGWRWAPKSLLLQLDAGFSYNSAIHRFYPPDSAAELGFVTEHGLKVRFPGLRIALRPWIKHESGRVWPWSWFMRHSVESHLACRHRSTGEWLTLCNWMRGENINAWTMEEWTKRDMELIEKAKAQPGEGKRPSQPIFNELRQEGELVLIQDTTQTVSTGKTCLLARLQTTSTRGGPLHVHACLTVAAGYVSSSLWPGFDKLQDMARQVYRSEINQELLRFLTQQEDGREPDPEGEECKRIMQELRQEMERVAQEELAKDEDGHLKRVAEEFLGRGKQADVWKVMAGMVPYDLSVESLPDDQEWIVDGPVVGDGQCHDKCCSEAPRQPPLGYVWIGWICGGIHYLLGLLRAFGISW